MPLPKTIVMPLPNQENKNKEEMQTSTHELRWVQTYDPFFKWRNQYKPETAHHWDLLTK
jgi:hypothetical protein